MQLGTDVGVAYPESEIESLKNPTDVITLFFKALKRSIDSYIKDKDFEQQGITIRLKFRDTIDEARS